MSEPPPPPPHAPARHTPAAVWPRKTVAAPATVHGVTLFTAVEAELVIRPAAGGGLRFTAPGGGETSIPASVGHAVDEPRRTVLGRAGFCVQTVEHLLSALAGFGVTEAILEVNGPEMPIGDGSALPFADALAQAGVVAIAMAAGPSPVLEPIRPTAPMTVEEPAGGRGPAGGGARIVITPRETPGCSFVYRLDYGPDAPFPPQEARFTLPPGGDPQGYAAEIAPARTFSTLPEVLAFRKMGLFTHLQPSQMLVLGEEGPIDNVLRFENEPARHKLLDLIGDLALAGRPIQADVVATRSGHQLNRRAAAALAGLVEGAR